jgi:hypothetical protein
MTVETQLVGAFGEKVAEAELLRRGWRTANFNTSIKNAVDYDLIAVKGDRTIQLRVKTCGPGWNAFQFSSPKGQPLATENLPTTDYTILVQMGETREGDHFYVMPTCILRKQINAHRHSFLEQPRSDGEPRRDLGHWTLRLRPIRSGEERPNYGFEKKWDAYLDNWKSLDG